MNALTEENVQMLWLPKLIYENTDQKETTRLGDIWEWETLVVVDRETDEKQIMRSGLDVVDETEVFNGAENSLIMSQTYTHNFQCSYVLSAYPFDTQVNLMKLSVRIIFFKVYLSKVYSKRKFKQLYL